MTTHLKWRWADDGLDTGWRAETEEYVFLAGADDLGIYAQRMSLDEKLADQNIGFLVSYCKSTESAKRKAERWAMKI